MATSSIDNPVFINDDATAKRLLAAFEEADKRGQTTRPHTIKEKIAMEKAAKEYIKCLRRQSQKNKNIYMTEVEIIKANAKTKGIKPDKDILKAAKNIDNMREILARHNIHAGEEILANKRYDNSI
jgi:hypothetical protein